MTFSVIDVASIQALIFQPSSQIIGLKEKVGIDIMYQELRILSPSINLDSP